MEDCWHAGVRPGLDPVLREADMTGLEEPAAYQAIIIPAASIMLLDGRDEAPRALAAFRESFVPGGRLILDVEAPGLLTGPASMRYWRDRRLPGWPPARTGQPRLDLPRGPAALAAVRSDGGFRGIQVVFTRDMLDGFGCGGRLGVAMSLAARILVARAQATSRRAARKRRTELERELAGYATAADRCDLEAALDRYPDGVTHELRSILARQYMTAEETRFPAIGRN